MLNKLNPAQVLLIGFACMIFVGAILLALPFSTASGEGQPIIDSLFTATSAVCVTGLVVKDTGSFYSLFGQIVILVLLQLGGLGYMTMATMLVLIVGRRISLRDKIVMKEAFSHFSLGGLAQFVKYIFLFTFFLELTGALILSCRWMFDFPPLEAIYMGIFQSVSAFCNAGFDIFGRVYEPFTSLSAYKGDIIVNVTMGSLIFLGGLGYIVLSELYFYPKTRKFSLHSKVVLFFSLILVFFGAWVFFISEYYNPYTIGTFSIKDKILVSFFQSVTMRTAGFNTVNVSFFMSGTLFLTAFLMFIGASPGGTGGGIKTTTIGTMIATVWATISRKKDVTVFNRRLPSEIINKSFVVGFISISFIILITLIMLGIERGPFIDIFFEVVSAFGTVGLSTGVTPYLSNMSKLLIIVTMYVGRLGPLTVGIAVLQDQSKLKIRYPEERIFVG